MGREGGGQWRVLISLGWAGGEEGRQWRIVISLG